jgi:hypothetical protein
MMINCTAAAATYHSAELLSENQMKQTRTHIPVHHQWLRRLLNTIFRCNVWQSLIYLQIALRHVCVLCSRGAESAFA